MLEADEPDLDGGIVQDGDGLSEGRSTYASAWNPCDERGQVRRGATDPAAGRAYLVLVAGSITQSGPGYMRVSWPSAKRTT